MSETSGQYICIEDLGSSLEGSFLTFSLLVFYLFGKWTYDYFMDFFFFSQENTYYFFAN